MFSSRHILTLVFVLLLVTACGKAPAATVIPTFPPDSPEGRGYNLFSGKGRCASCHSLSPDVVIVGPSLAGIASRAEKRIPSLAAADYLEESIIAPDDFKVPGFDGISMDASLAKTLNTDEVADLVAYMLTLK